jgi:hypothetical protein
VSFPVAPPPLHHSGMKRNGKEENGTDDNWKKGRKSRPDIYDDERKEEKVLSPPQKKRAETTF